MHIRWDILYIGCGINFPLYWELARVIDTSLGCPCQDWFENKSRKDSLKVGMQKPVRQHTCEDAGLARLYNLSTLVQHNHSPFPLFQTPQQRGKASFRVVCTECRTHVGWHGTERMMNRGMNVAITQPLLRRRVQVPYVTHIARATLVYHAGYEQLPKQWRRGTVRRRTTIIHIFPERTKGQRCYWKTRTSKHLLLYKGFMQC
jgi:hypothetical protein